jgi:hypothetical protein
MEGGFLQDGRIVVQVRCLERAKLPNGVAVSIKAVREAFFGTLFDGWNFGLLEKKRELFA